MLSCLKPAVLSRTRALVCLSHRRSPWGSERSRDGRALGSCRAAQEQNSPPYKGGRLHPCTLGEMRVGCRGGRGLPGSHGALGLSQTPKPLPPLPGAETSLGFAPSPVNGMGVSQGDHTCLGCASVRETVSPRHPLASGAGLLAPAGPRASLPPPGCQDRPGSSAGDGQTSTTAVQLEEGTLPNSPQHTWGQLWPVSSWPR